jgi:hypothetical protein
LLKKERTAMTTALSRAVQVAVRPVLRRVAAFAAVVSATTALGQVAPVDPYWAVVASPDAVLRSGDRDLYYPVARLTAGQLVRVDGEGGGWARVAYPKDLTAFIAADAVTPAPNGKSVTLTRPEKPRAARLDATKATGSWRTLGDAALPVGASLTLAHPAALEDTGGKSAYRVLAPESARGYLPLAAIQRATQGQIDAFLGSVGLQSKPAPGDTQQGGKPAPSAEPVQAVGTAQPAAPKEPTLLERLDSAFLEVKSQPTERAEFTELIAEYEKVLAATPEDQFNRVTRARLQQRIDVLKLRAEYQKQLLAMAEAKPEVDEATKRAAAALAEVEKVRTYDAVGRLSASTIYDGKRLPLMYRIQSVGSPLPRTIAYLKPDQMKLEAKVGQLVGVIGEASMDPDLKLKIIVPRRVDVLQPEPAPTPPAP